MILPEMFMQKHKKLYELRPPLDKALYDEAKANLSDELFALLKESNGILLLMEHPKANGGKPFVTGSIIYPFEEMKSHTAVFKELFSEEGFVIAGNGAGGYFVLKNDGKIFLYEYAGEEGSMYAECLTDYLNKI